eukprot:611384-Amphidinium_carterae.1
MGVRADNKVLFRPWRQKPSMRIRGKNINRIKDLIGLGFEHCVLIDEHEQPCWHPTDIAWCVVWSDSWTYPGEDMAEVQYMNRSDRRKMQGWNADLIDSQGIGVDQEWCWPVFDDEEERVHELEDMREEIEPLVEENWEPPHHVAQAVHHLHCNLGHPSKPALLRLMRRGGAKMALLKWVRHKYVCSSCQASTRPPAHNPATAGTTYAFNHIVAVDLLHMECPFRPVGEQVPVKTAEQTLAAFSKCWLQYFSYPKILVCDQGGEFEGVFQQALGQGGTLQHTTDSQSPWQNGRCERAHEHLRRMFELAEQEIVPTSEAE